MPVWALCLGFFCTETEVRKKLIKAQLFPGSGALTCQRMHPDAGKAPASYGTAMTVFSRELNYKFISRQMSLNTLKPKQLLVDRFSVYFITIFLPVPTRGETASFTLHEWHVCPGRVTTGKALLQKPQHRPHCVAFTVHPKKTWYRDHWRRVCVINMLTGGNEKRNLSAQLIFWPNTKSTNFC